MIGWIRAHPKVAASAGTAVAVYVAWFLGIFGSARREALSTREKREGVRRSLSDLAARGVPSVTAVTNAEEQLAREQEEARRTLDRIALQLPEEYVAPDPDRAAEAFDTRRAEDERRFERRISWQQRMRGLGFAGHPAPDEASDWLARLWLVATFLDLALEAGVREVEAVDPLGEPGGGSPETPEGAVVRALRVRLVVLGSSEGVFKLAHALVDPDRSGFVALAAFEAAQVAPGQDRLRAEFTIAGLEPVEEER